MSLEVGRIDLGLDVNQKSFNRQLNGLAGGAEKQAKRAFSGLGTKIGVALGVTAIASFTKSCLGLGSALSEVQNVVDTVFPSLNGQVNSFAKNAMEQFGLSETIAKKYTGTLGAMSKSMGFSEQAALSMSKGITGLSGDVASFYNITSDEAYTKLKSIWTGETESLKELGVVMTQTNLEQYAMNNGFGKSIKNMDEQTRVMLRYQYVTSALATAQGDFAKTSDSWANQTRVLTLRFDSLKATLGQGFINLFTPIIQSLNILLGKLQGVANGFKSVTEALFGKQTVQSAGAVSESALDAANNIIGVGDAVKDAKKSLMGFDELNVLSSSHGTANDSGTVVDAPDTATPGNDAIETNGGLSKSLEKLKDAISPTLDALGELSGVLKPIGEFVFSNIKSFYNDILKPIGSWALGEGIPGLVGALSDLLDDINWPNLSEAIKNFNKAIAPMAISVGKGFIQFVKDAASFLSPVLAVTIDLLAVALNALADMVNNVDPDTWEAAGYGIGVVATSLAGIKIAAGLPALLLMIKEGLIGIVGIISNLQYLNPMALPALFDLLGFDDWLDNLYNMLPDWATDLWEGLWQALGDMVSAVFNFDETAKIWAKVVKAFKDAFDADTWYEIGWNIIKGIFLGIVGILAFPIEAVIDFFDTLWKAICNVFGINSPAEKMKPLGANILLGILKGFTGKFGEWWGAIVTWGKGTISRFGVQARALWFAVQKPFVAVGSWFSEKFAGAWSAIKKVFTPFGKFFQDLWDGIKNGFAAALGKLKDIARVPMNAIIGLMNGMLKGLTAGINALISAVNSLYFEFPDWVPGLGGKYLSFDISKMSTPEIPQLADGGYVGVNQPQLAMIGDNKREGEIVSPESKFQEMLNAAASLSGGGLSEEALYRVMSRVLRENQMVLVPDENGIVKTVKKGSDEYRKATGKPLFGY